MTTPEVFAEYRAAKAAAEEAKSVQRPEAKALERAATRKRDAIMKENDGLVWRVAKRLLGSRWKNIDNQKEALQEGRIGLMRAIDEYDASRGSAFSTVAALWIRHHVQNCMHHQVDFAKQRSACMPPRAVRAVTKFRTIHGREPEPHEIQYEHRGENVTPTREQWERWLDSTLVVSVEDMGAGDDDSRPSDELVADARTSPDLLLASTHLQAKLSDELESMSPRNRDMSKMLFVDGRSLTDVAEHYDLSVERVRELKGVLEKRLRKVLAPALA